MNKKYYHLVIITIIVIFGFTLFKCFHENKKLKEAIPYLLLGEKIDYFNLNDMNGEDINNSVLKDNRTSLIFIFSRPCSPCDRNIAFWNRIAKILKDKVLIYGIILNDNNEAHNFHKNKKLNFKIFIPADLNRFLKKMRIRLNLAQTILYHDNKVRIIKIGDLTGDDFTYILKEVKKLLKK